MVKTRRWTISQGSWGEPKSPPNSCWYLKNLQQCRMSKRHHIFRERKISDLQEEISTKSPDVFWQVHKPTKKASLVNEPKDSLMV